MEDEANKKKVNEDAVTFLRKRSESEVPRYTARLKTYVDFHKKRTRADAARSRHQAKNQPSANTAAARNNVKLTDGNKEVRRLAADERSIGSRLSRSGGEASDGCCPKRPRRRRSRTRRRRRSCRRRRRRSGRRRRRRSCGRRRRRRSSRRRRRRCVRRRRRCSRRRRRRRC